MKKKTTFYSVCLLMLLTLAFVNFSTKGNSLQELSASAAQNCVAAQGFDCKSANTGIILQGYRDADLDTAESVK